MDGRRVGARKGKAERIYKSSRKEGGREKGREGEINDSGGQLL